VRIIIGKLTLFMAMNRSVMRKNNRGTEAEKHRVAKDKPGQNEINHVKGNYSKGDARAESSQTK